jgi:hypothetical protein
MSDHKQKQDSPCPCGDAAHRNLENWYASYVALPGLDTLALGDKFCEAFLNEKIQEVSLQVPVSNGYCPNCQKLLNEWSEMTKKVPEYVPDERAKPYKQPHFKNTLHFEAGYRNGCLLCTLFVECATDKGYSLENWHRKENRLNCLGKSTRILVNVYRDNGHFFLLLTWPGLDNTYWSPVRPLYCVKNHDQGLFLTRRWAFWGMGLTSARTIQIGKRSHSSHRAWGLFTT